MPKIFSFIAQFHMGAVQCRQAGRRDIGWADFHQTLGHCSCWAKGCLGFDHGTFQTTFTHCHLNDPRNHFLWWDFHSPQLAKAVVVVVEQGNDLLQAFHVEGDAHNGLQHHRQIAFTEQSIACELKTLDQKQLRRRRRWCDGCWSCC